MLLKGVSLVCLLLLTAQVVSSQSTDSTDGLSYSINMFHKYLDLSKDEQFQLDERKVFSQKAIDLSKTINDGETLMEALSSYGYILAQEGHYAKAMELFTRIRTISDSMGFHNISDWRRKAYMANVMGLLNKELGQYDEALSLYFHSLSISDSVNWDEGKSTALNNISILYNLHGNTEQAISILKDSWKIAETDNNKGLLLDISVNLMEMYVETKNFDSARIYCYKALDLAKINNTPYDLAFVDIGFAKLYYAEKNYDSALIIIENSIVVSLENGFENVSLEALLLSSRIYRGLNELKKSEETLSRAIEIDHKINIPLLHIELLKERSLLSEAKNNYKEAYVLHKYAAELNDSINKSWDRVKYAEIQSLYAIKLHKQRNMVLQKNLSIKQLQLTQQKYLIFITLGFLILLGGLALLFYRKRKFERKTNILLQEQNEKINTQEKIIRIKNEHSLKQELDYKNRQLTTFSLSVLKQSKSLEIVLAQINELLYQQNIKSATRKKLEEVIRHFRPHNSQKEWEEFRSYFEDVHPSYYTSLKEICPDLSLNEQKVCAYLRLGMSTKEIASITFRQVRSVESTRFRIRKKLGLTASDNLNMFLERL
ncbi:MAG: tetratricopeptide repeat protein [Bacteroidota bacterium]